MENNGAQVAGAVVVTAADMVAGHVRLDISCLEASGVPVIRFKAGDRKAEVMAPYLEAAAASGRSQVAAVGCAQEFQSVQSARKRDTDPGKPPQFSFTKEQRRVLVFTYTSSMRRWAWGSSRSAPTSRIRSRYG